MRFLYFLLILPGGQIFAAPPPAIQYQAMTTNKLVVAGSNVNFSLSGTTLSINAKTDTNTATPTTRTISTTSPLAGGGDLSANRTLTIADAAADGGTKGVASFYPGDFDSTSGEIFIDYANAQQASAFQNGFLSLTDWLTFNAKVGTSRSISTTVPLAGGGDLSADRTLTIADAAADGSTKGAATFTASDFNSSSGNISIDYANGQAASGSVKGFLTSADWTTFNGKQASGSYITALTGAVTASGPGSSAASLGSFSSASLSGALTDETGTGAAVFADSPVFTTKITSPQWAATTNQATMAPNFLLGYQDIQTNAAFTVVAPINVDATKFETCVVIYTNSTAAVVVITPPANCHAQGTANVTNVTVVTYTHDGNKWTNAVFFPIF